MAKIGETKDRLVKRGAADIVIVLYELRQLIAGLEQSAKRADEIKVIIGRLNDTLATLESFTSNRMEILKVDHVGCTETLCAVDQDVLVLALSDMSPGCIQKIEAALAEVKERK